MNIFKGKIKYTAGKVYDGQFGQSINAVITLTNGEDVRVYGKPDDEKLKSLKKDEEVTVIYDNKSYKVAFDMTTADTIEPKDNTAQINSQKFGKLTVEELQEKAIFMTDLYADIYHQLLGRELEPLQAQPAAATIFIQIGKFL